MKKYLILLFIVLLAPFTVAEDKSISVTFSTDGRALEVGEVDLYLVAADTYIFDEDDNLVATLKSFNGEDLFNLTFSNVIGYSEDPMPDEIYEEFISNEGGKEISFNIMFPYYREVKEIVVTNKGNGKTVLTVDISHLQLCNFNNYCEAGEDLRNCPEDCRAKVAVDEKEEVEEKFFEPEPEVSKKKSYVLPLAIVGTIFLIALIFVLLIRSKKRFGQ